LAAELALTLDSSSLLPAPNDLLVDDRTHLTVGKRLLDATKLGIPYVVVIGRRCSNAVDEPLIELHDLSSSGSSSKNERSPPQLLNATDLIEYIREASRGIKLDDNCNYNNKHCSEELIGHLNK
jgi:hypothetical protein